MEKVKIGMLGAIGRSFCIARDMLATGREIEVTAICDTNPKNLQKGLESITKCNGDKAPKAFTDYKDLLDSGLVNTIIVGTPDFVHKEQTCAALEAGMHVLCEKPLAINLEDIDEMAKTALAHPKQVFMTGLCLRYNKFFEEMKRIAMTGELGEIKYANCVDSVSRGGMYYFHRWMSKRKFVNSVLLQKGCHSIDIVNWILEDTPCEVFAYGGLDYYGGDKSPELRCSNCDEADTCRDALKTHTAEYDDGGADIVDECAFSSDVDVCDNTVLITKYVNGAKMSYSESHLTPDYIREFTFVGTKGQMKCTLPQARPATLEVTMRGPSTSRAEFDFEGYTTKMNLTHDGHGGGDQGISEAFVRALLDGEKPHADIHAGRESAAVAILAEKSIETGCVQKIPNIDGTSRS